MEGRCFTLDKQSFNLYRRRCSSGFHRQNMERLKLFCLIKKRILRV
ncbi:unnamed protein product [Brassica rapa subsp. trilocularis]